MANIGAPIRKFVAIPVKEPVQPTREPQPKPVPAVQPEPVKEKEPT